MRTTPTFRDRAKYHFDNFMARGGKSTFVGLVVIFTVFLLVIFLFRVALSIVLPESAPGNDRGTVTNALIAFLQMLDPGSMAEDLSASRWYMLAAIVTGIGGVIMLSVLIAFLTTSLDARLSKLRRGHSRVIEQGHTLILGWEERRVVEIIHELTIANESERRKAIVVLADEDKEYMDDYLSLQLPDTKTTKIVTRTGSPTSTVNLVIVSSSTAKSAIVLADCSESASDSEKAESDARVIKTLLALEIEQTSENNINVVAELFGAEARAMCSSVGIDNLHALDITKLLARVLVQTSRSIGLSVVYDEILSFDGSEMYLTSDGIEGSTFGEALFQFWDAVPIGFKAADGDIRINPPPQTRLSSGDALIVLAEDDSTIRREPTEPTSSPECGGSEVRIERHLERQLVVGWGPKARQVLDEYSRYVVEGSRVDVIPRSPCESDAAVGDLDVNMMHINPLDPLAWKTINILEYDHVILLGESGPDTTPETVDAETIMILLLLRNAVERDLGRHPGRRPTVVTELLESGTQAVAVNVGVHDFVVSSRVVSMMLAQIAEQPAMYDIFESLFDDRGSEIYLKPAGLYTNTIPAELTFGEWTALASARNEVCIGVKLKVEEDRSSLNFGVRLTPSKDTAIALGEADRLIVVAEDET